ncbi:hypothetical protein ACWGDX_36580 [Streptomyces sp. NPDC055025]
MLPRATAWLSARATALARHHHQRAARTEATPWAVYDAIKGLAGIGRVLLAAHARATAPTPNRDCAPLSPPSPT